MTGYRELEEKVQLKIYQRFGIVGEDPPELGDIDRLLVRYEMWRGFGNGFYVHRNCNAEEAKKYPPLTKEEKRLFIGWEPWSWEKAEREFLFRYDELTSD